MLTCSIPRLREATSILVCLLTTASCGVHSPSSPPPPALVHVRDIRLQESESTYVARIGGFAVGPDGSVFIADLLNANVLQFDASGIIRRRIGRRGRGPGELVQPGALAIVDSMMYVVNGGFELNAYRLPQGEFVWKRLLPSRPVFTMEPSPQGLLINVTDSARRSVVGVVRSRDDSARFVALYPPPLGRSRAVDAWYSYPKYSSWSDDSIAVAIEASEFLYWGTLTSASFDSIRIPRVRRRGARPDLYSKVTSDPNSMRPLLYRTSHPWAMKRLTSGLVAYVVTDQEFSRNRFSGEMFVSLVDRKRRVVCTDIPIPAPRDPQAWVGFSGDTLDVLAQDLDSAGRPIALVRQYIFSTPACEWSDAK